jgi:hypothetical protein
MKITLSYLNSAAFVKLTDYPSLHIDDISQDSKSGIQAGLYLLKLTVRDKNS